MSKITIEILIAKTTGVIKSPTTFLKNFIIMDQKNYAEKSCSNIFLI